MNITAVESTTLSTIAYDDARDLLQLEFCSGAIYQYFDVPAAVHADLLYAPSKGILRIPLKWGTNSGEVGQRRSEATLVTAMISEVPHISQEFCW